MEEALPVVPAAREAEWTETKADDDINSLTLNIKKELLNGHLNVEGYLTLGAKPNLEISLSQHQYEFSLEILNQCQMDVTGEISTDTTVFASTRYQNGNVSSYQYMNDISFITVTGGNVLLVDVKSNPTDAELESMQVGEIYVESGSLHIKQ